MYTKIIIGIDPAVTCGPKSDETGIVVVGKGSDNHGYVLDDLSLKGPPSSWAAKVVKAYYDYNAHYIVAETNQGGDLVETILKTVDPTVRFKSVRAIKNKRSRAEPIAMLYEQGKIFHTKAFPQLEQQMCQFNPEKGKSPDRVDALVWAFTELMKPALKTSPKCWAIDKS